VAFFVLFCFFPVYFLLLLLVCFVIVGFLFLFLCLLSFFLSILPTLPSWSSHPFSQPLHSSPFSCAKIHCSPSQQLILSLLTHCLPLPSPSPPICSQPATRLPLSPTHSSLADQCTIPTLHNPNLLQSLTQAPYTTTTEIHPNTHKGHKNQQPPHHFPTHLPHFPPPLLVPPYPTPQTSVSSLTNINHPPNSHCL
jgi:hypothetical protein